MHGFLLTKRSCSEDGDGLRKEHMALLFHLNNFLWYWEGLTENVLKGNVRQEILTCV